MEGRAELAEREVFEVAKKSFVVCLLFEEYKSGWEKSKAEGSGGKKDPG